LISRSSRMAISSSSTNPSGLNGMQVEFEF
jgi:hypothetical protein